MSLFTKLSSWASILITVVAAIIVVGLVSWGTYTLVKPSPQKLPEGGEQPIQQQPAQQPRDETANWKTYRNEEYGFEVKYPGDWGIQTVNSLTGADDPKGERIILWSKRNYKDFISTLGTEGLKEGIYSFIIQYKDNKRSSFIADPSIRLISSEQVTVDNVDGTKDKFAGPYGEWTTIYLNKDGIIFSLTLPDKNEEQKEMANQILSTFKFIE